MSIRELTQEVEFHTEEVVEAMDNLATAIQELDEVSVTVESEGPMGTTYHEIPASDLVKITVEVKHE